jgi:hypothetical protein
VAHTNGSVKVVGSAGSFAAYQHNKTVPMRAHRPHSSTRCVVFFVTDARELFSWYAPHRCEEQGRATSAVRLPPPHQQRECGPGDDRALGTPVPGFPQCAAASLQASGALLPRARGRAQ